MSEHFPAILFDCILGDWRDLMTPATATGDPPFRRELSNHPQTLRGSFSAVSTAPIATKYSFFQDFRDLQDSHSFAPLHTQIFVNFSFLFLQFFHQISSFFANFESISRFFEQILMKICRNFTGLKNASQNFGEISNFDELGVRGLPKKLK